MVNEDNEAVYCKFHYKTDQGIKCFDRLVLVIGIIIVIVKMKLCSYFFLISMILFYRHQADEMAKQDPDYAIR